jgi:hypothetical protein
MIRGSVNPISLKSFLQQCGRERTRCTHEYAMCCVDESVDWLLVARENEKVVAKKVAGLGFLFY